MKAIIITLVALAVLGGGIAIAKNNSDTNSAKPVQSSQAEVNAELAAIQQSMVEGALLIDVRTPQEYAVGHAEGAMNLPNEDIQAGAAPEAGKDQKLYVYCRSGNRSNQAAQKLAAAGYANITDLGPMTTWSDMGGKIVQ